MGTSSTPAVPKENVHPAVKPVIDAFDNLAEYQPTDHADLAEVLRSLHLRGRASLVERLWQVLRGFADWYDAVNGSARTDATDHGSELATELYSAAELIAVGAGEHLDRARALVGHLRDETGEAQQ